MHLHNVTSNSGSNERKGLSFPFSKIQYGYLYSRVCEVLALAPDLSSLILQKLNRDSRNCFHLNFLYSICHNQGCFYCRRADPFPLYSIFISLNTKGYKAECLKTLVIYYLSILSVHPNFQLVFGLPSLTSQERNSIDSVRIFSLGLKKK